MTADTVIFVIALVSLALNGVLLFMWQRSMDDADRLERSLRWWRRYSLERESR